MEQYIEKCVDSIILQKDFKETSEILLVDDGSTDKSGKICDEYANQYSNIRVIHKENEGLLMARGTAVKEAVGEYYIFVDSDDYIESNLLSSIDIYIERFKPDFLCYGHFNESERKKERKSITDKPYELIDKKSFLEMFVSSNKYNNIWSKVVKGAILKNHFDEIYNFKTNIGEDKIQTAYLIKYSEKICLIKDCLYHYMFRNNSIVHTKSEKDLFDSLVVYGMVGNVIKETLLLNEVKEEKEHLICQYYNSALNAMMEHIYKYTRQKNIDNNTKIEILALINNSELFNLDINQIELKTYNKFRYILIISKNYKLLIVIDKILFFIQKIIGTAI